MFSLQEVAKIEAEQDKKYNARKGAFRVLGKAFDEYAYVPFREIMDKLSNGKALNDIEFNAVKNMAEKYGKPIPLEKLEFIKHALMNPLILRSFNQFGQELK